MRTRFIFSTFQRSPSFADNTDNGNDDGGNDDAGNDDDDKSVQAFNGNEVIFNRKNYEYLLQMH